MPRGIPNKPKEKSESHPFEQAANPDQWNSRAEAMDYYNEKAATKEPIESSIPIGELAYKTEGLNPRTRSAFTRTADDRVNHFIDQYAKQTKETFRGKTHMPKECVPAGRQFMWARKTVSGRPDDHNIGNLQSKHGWQVASADEYPGYAFYSDDGGVNDSASTLYMGGLIGMDRDDRIHAAQINHLAKLRNEHESQLSALKSTNPGSAPRSLSNMEDWNNQFFPSTEGSRSHASSF